MPQRFISGEPAASRRGKSAAEASTHAPLHTERLAVGWATRSARVDGRRSARHGDRKRNSALADLDAASRPRGFHGPRNGGV